MLKKPRANPKKANKILTIYNEYIFCLISYFINESTFFLKCQFVQIYELFLNIVWLENDIYFW